jgi:protease stability complex PrcB-like protein
MIDWHRQDAICKRDARHLFGRLEGIFAILFSLIATCPACSSEATKPGEKPKPTIATAEAPTTRLSFLTIDKGSQSGVREPLQTVVRGPAEWKTLWQKHASIKPNPLPAPAVDFSKEIVVGVFLGEKPTGGNDIDIIRIEQSGAALVIEYREKNPLPGSIVTQALTQPFHIVKVFGASSLRASFRRAS